jgi:hypothetical protein
VTTATSSATQGFSLANSGDATEIAWADANVQKGPWKLQDKDEAPWWLDDDCWTVDINGASSAKVAMVKAGQTYKYYLNVQDGQTLCSYDPPGSEKPKDISHITYLNCK